MKHIKGFTDYIKESWKDAHKKLFISSDEDPTLLDKTNFITVGISTHQVITSEKSVLFEVIQLDKPYSIINYYSKKESFFTKLYIYKLIHHSKRHAGSYLDAGFFMGVNSQGGESWIIEYDLDANSIFSPYPLSSKKNDFPEPVYDYFESFNGELSGNEISLSELRKKQTWRYKQHIHHSYEIYFMPDGTIDNIVFHNYEKSIEKLPVDEWVGKNISDSEIEEFFISNGYYRHQNG